MTSPSGAKPPTLAVIGCGWWGPKLVRVFNQISEDCIKTVADLSDERLTLIKRRYPKIHTTADYRELLADPEIHGVCVATPMETHYAIAREVLLSGKHLLLEKPMTTDARQAEELLRLAEEKGLTLLVDHIFLYTPAINHLRSLLQSGKMGQLYYSESTRINLAPPHATHNVVWDLAPHDVSICLYLFGETPHKVVCHAERYRHPSLEDAASLHLFFPSGKRAEIHASWLGSCKTREMR
ncbi:MAG: Gfo/Idh/MocA family oxidoreductase, partial [bacterium]